MMDSIQSNETRIQLLAVNQKKIEPEVNYVTEPVINDGISNTSGEDLTQHSFLRLMVKVMDEKNLILLEKERLANELSLLKSQLTDSNSKLQVLQNVRDELAIIKSELEKKKSVQSSRVIALRPSATHWTYFKESGEDLVQFTPHRTLFESDCDVQHYSNTAELVRSQHPPYAVKAKDLLRYIATEEVGCMRYLPDEKYPNELYPWSLVQEVRSNQIRSRIKPWKQLRFLESFNPEKPDLVKDLQTSDNQFRLKPGDPQLLHLNAETIDSFEKKNNQPRLQPDDQHPLPKNKKNLICWRR